MHHRTAFRTGASSSKRPPSPLQYEEEEDKENIIYSCALEIASTLDEFKLITLVDRY